MRRQVASVSIVAREDQPKAGNTAAGSVGRSRGLQPVGCRAAKAGRKSGDKVKTDKRDAVSRRACTVLGNRAERDRLTASQPAGSRRNAASTDGDQYPRGER